MMQTVQTISNTDMFNSYTDIVTVSEMAKMLRIGRNRAYELIRSKTIPCVKIGSKQTRITKQAVIDYIASEEAKSN